jgi:hypothetical protein
MTAVALSRLGPCREPPSGIQNADMDILNLISGRGDPFIIRRVTLGGGFENVLGEICLGFPALRIRLALSSWPLQARLASLV